MRNIFSRKESIGPKRYCCTPRLQHPPVVMARGDLSSTTNRAPDARAAPTFSTVEEAHTGLIERLAGSEPHRILYIVDARDLEERAEHLQQILGAVLDYVGAIVADTDHVAPGGSIDRRYLLGLISDVAGDVAGSIANAADDLAAGKSRGEGLVKAVKRRQCVAYLLDFLWIRLLSLTPGPLPLSSMNSTPAASSAWRTAKSFAAFIRVSLSVSSARRIVATLTADSRARSSALHLMRARAALI
jgi:hypothetical protein